MPYDNSYNRAIANKMDDIDWRYANLYAYSPVDGRGGYSGGGSSAGVLFQMGNASKRDAEDNIVNDNVSGELPPVYYYGNDSEGMKGGNGFAEGTYRDRGDGGQLGAESATGFFDKQGSGVSGGMGRDAGSVNPFTGGYGMSGGMDGGSLWTDIYDGFSDLGSDIGKAVDYINPFGGGHPLHHQDMKARLFGRMLGKMMKHHMMGKGVSGGDGMSGGSWWSALKDGISDVVDFVPDLIIHGLGKKKAGRPKKAKVEGGAILGNPDPYPVQGNSERVAGRGRGRPKKMKGCGKEEVARVVGGAKELVGEKQGDLLAMPSVVLANGVPPKAQLRGSYGGAKPSKAKDAVMKAVEKKLKGGKNLSGMTDKRAEMGGKNLSGMTDKRAEMDEKITSKMGTGVSGGDGRKARAEIVKKIMKEKGMKMIEASKYVKEHGLYKK